MNYLTLEDVKDAFMGTWDDAWDSGVTKSLPVVSAKLRMLFRGYKRDLDKDLLDGKVEEVLLKDVAASMIIRKVQASNIGTAGLNLPEFSNLSQSVGQYSMSITPINSNTGFYVKKDERQSLGLPIIAMGGINMNYSKDAPNV